MAQRICPACMLARVQIGILACCVVVMVFIPATASAVAGFIPNANVIATLFLLGVAATFGLRYLSWRSGRH